jgi:hypothetical protein
MLRNSKTLKENKHCEVFVVCSYGKSEQKYEHYTQIAGQKGWEFLSDDEKMYQKVMVGFINNTDLLQDLKNRVFGDLENSVVDYWVKNFYTNNQFNSMKYLDFVSAKDKK